MILRKGTSDNFVNSETDYDNITFEPGSVWFDIGANIGTFPRKFANKIGTIVSFEPELMNYSLLLANTKLLTNVVCVNAAVVNDEQHVGLFINTGENKAKHTTLELTDAANAAYNLQPVAGMQLESLLRSYRPDGLKIDIEGGEYSLLNCIIKLIDSGKLGGHDSFMKAPELIFELHFNEKLFEKANALEANLLIEALQKYYSIKCLAKDASYKTAVYHAKAKIR